MNVVLVVGVPYQSINQLQIYTAPYVDSESEVLIYDVYCISEVPIYARKIRREHEVLSL